MPFKRNQITRKSKCLDKIKYGCRCTIWKLILFGYVYLTVFTCQRRIDALKSFKTKNDTQHTTEHAYENKQTKK